MSTVPTINEAHPMPGMQCTRVAWSTSKRPRLIRHEPTFWQWLVGATAYYTVEAHHEFSISCTYEPSEVAK